MYLISTKEFGISKSAFHIFRGALGARKYELNEIDYIAITYGSLVKNKISTALFGMVFIVLTVMIIHYFSEIEGFQIADFVNNGKNGAVTLGMIIFLSFMGFWVLYQVFKYRIILKIQLFDGNIESFKLEKIINDQRLTELIRILSLYFTPNQLRVHKKLAKKYSGDTAHSHPKQPQP